MEEYIEQTERFLRGQMSQQEELVFKEAIVSDRRVHSLALQTALIIKFYKTSQ